MSRWLLLPLARSSSTQSGWAGTGEAHPCEHSRFARGAVVWELNYRGDLGFLSVANRREEVDRLSMHDGWRLFCHGWAAAFTPILGLVDEPQLADQFAEAIGIWRRLDSDARPRPAVPSPGVHIS